VEWPAVYSIQYTEATSSRTLSHGDSGRRAGTVIQTVRTPQGCGRKARRKPRDERHDHGIRPERAEQGDAMRTIRRHLRWFVRSFARFPLRPYSRMPACGVPGEKGT